MNKTTSTSSIYCVTELIGTSEIPGRMPRNTQ